MLVCVGVKFYPTSNGDGEPEESARFATILL
jgi:hypothetical protein